MGYVFEEHEIPTNLYGYMGDKREQVAHIIVRRKYIGSASNDIGLYKRSDGKYELIISEYDKGISQGKAFMQQFKQKYVVNTAKKMLKKKGYKLKKHTVEVDGTVELRFS